LIGWSILIIIYIFVGYNNIGLDCEPIFYLQVIVDEEFYWVDEREGPSHFQKSFCGYFPFVEVALSL
jgi:hypothetical protein